ncbi:MAG TPA: CPBP family intramembrane glutamic endopeptidase [Acidimicrobiales bacterium]|nr:CPBP family intramembrane glutamic endopeptidase [Acidimicrobiales bacterium]
MEPVLNEGPFPSPEHQPRWALGDVALGFLAAIFNVAVAQAVWVGVTGDDDVSLGLTIVSFLAYWPVLVGTTVIASRRRGTGSLAHDMGLRVEKGDILPGVLTGLASQFVLLPLLYLPFELLNGNLDVSEKAEETLGVASGRSLLLLAVLVIAVAPVVEELFFRGLLQRTLAQRVPPLAAIGISGLVFGVTHFQPIQLLGLVAFGWVLGTLAQRAGRLGPSLVAHMTFNAASVVVIVLWP